MRGEDDVGQAAQHGVERVPLLSRLVGQHVDGGAVDVAADEMVAQRLVVDDEAAGEVEEQAATAHPGELLGAEQPRVACAPVDVQRHRLRALEQLL